MKTQQKIDKLVKRVSTHKLCNEKTTNGDQTILNPIDELEGRFLNSNPHLTTEALLPYLSSEDLASKIHIYSTLESTNKTAKEMALNGHKHGTVVLADTQTAGRGRHGRYFHSPSSSGLYMSFILHPEALNFENPIVVTAFAAVVVCEAIRKVTQKKAGIKWVNDIFIDGIKVGGILTEAMTCIENKRIHSLILGIGVNITTPTEAFPEELRLIVGSLQPDGKDLSIRNRLASEIINNINYSQLTVEEIFKKYKNYSFILGQKITVIQGESTYKATALDITSTGQLRIKKENNERLTLSSGEVRIRVTD